MDGGVRGGALRLQFENQPTVIQVKSKRAAGDRAALLRPNRLARAETVDGIAARTDDRTDLVFVVFVKSFTTSLASNLPHS
jgi:hypothetical protein